MSNAWYIRNVREVGWRHVEGRGAVCELVDEPNPQIGINLFVLGAGEPMAMYHWEADQEDFLVLSGEGIAIVDGEERPIRQWDLVHTPPGVAKVIVGGPCVVLAIGAREHQEGDDWGAYPVNETALAHNAGFGEETNDPELAYSQVPHRKPTPFREAWLPD